MQLVVTPSGYRLVGFSDFQRNYRFGLNLADRDVDLIDRNKFVGVLSFVFPRL